MMKVYLDAKPIEVSGHSLTSALDAVRAQAQGRLIIEAQADGQPVPPEHLTHPPENTPYAGELRFVSTDPVAIVRESLLETADLLKPARDRHRHLADRIASAETEIALQQLPEVLAVWQQVMATLQLVRSCDLVAIPAQPPEDLDIDDAAAQLNAHLVDLRMAIQKQDWSALSDLLAFDLIEDIDRWTTMLSDIARFIQHAPPTNP